MFSYAMLLYFMLAKKYPYDSLVDFFAVYHKDERPPIQQDWNPKLVHVIKTCWQADRSKRMSAQQVLDYLK